MTTHLTDQAKTTAPPLQETSSVPWLLSLDDVDGSTLPIVGGKAFRLALLKEHGFNVLPGLVLTSHFFETQIQHTKLTPLWAGSPDIAVTAESLIWLADALKTKPLANELQEALDQHLDVIFGSETQSFAVRSSVVDEDQRDTTFAGIHLTELGVPRSALAIAITRCWASALQGPAIQYRQNHGMPLQNIRPALLIQPMLTPHSSGVGFTVNPLTGTDDEFVIEAVHGLGNRLVSGEVQPYQYRLSNQPPDYPLLEKQTGNAQQSEETGIEPLSASQRAELAHQLRQVQALMGEPQDVEWALQQDEIFILQSRPVSIASEPASDQEWSRARYPDILPNLPSPLFVATLERAQQHIMQFFKQLGFDTTGIGPYEQVKLGRPYVNLTLLKKLLVQVGLHPASFLQATGYIESGTAISKTFSVDWQTLWQARKIYGAILKQLLTLRKDVKAIETVCNEVKERLTDVDAHTPRAAILDQLQEQSRAYQILAVTYLKLSISIGIVSLLGSSISKTPIRALQRLALRGFKTEPILLSEDLIILSQVAQQQEQINKFFIETDDFEAVAPQKLDLPAEFKKEFDAFLAKFGHRATYEADPAWPRFVDDPSALLNIVQQYVKNAPTHTDSIIASRQRFTQVHAIQELSLWRRWLTYPFRLKLRSLFGLRDKVDQARASIMAAIRHWNLTLGHRWADQGWLEQAEDIFWLNLAEIEQAIMRENDSTVALSATIQARKEQYQSYEKIQLPFVLTDAQIPHIQTGVEPSAQDTTDVMVGLPISPGQTRGTVVVIHQPDQPPEVVDDNMIFVMPSTDANWLSHLHLASGLIVETGGLLSHGSIIAREYRLPAVANIPNATRHFRAGDIVLVDGSTGVVQLLESAR